MTIKTEKYILPTKYASYLFYGEEDSLTEKEIDSINSFMGTVSHRMR